MFVSISKLSADPILHLSELFTADKRQEKVGVGIGVFQDESGYTPIMRAVKRAEQQVWQTQKSKKYLNVSGNLEFNVKMRELVLANSVVTDRVQMMQSVAGTGGLRLLAEFFGKVLPDATVWVSEPTWGNHKEIFSAAGLRVKFYPYYDTQSGEVNESALLAGLAACQPKDIVILHGCCHNPTGADLSEEQWHKVAEIIRKRQLLPIVDLAYLGFGRTIEQDAYGVRYLAQTLDYLWIVISCSKNFGLYRDRIGVVLTITPDGEETTIVQSHLENVSRAMISMPADHGAAIVATILATPELKKSWREELESMSDYIKLRRQQLATALNALSERDWSYIARQQGMFSMLPLGEARVQILREKNGVYMVGNGRINFAGLTSEAVVEYVAKAIITIL